MSTDEQPDRTEARKGEPLPRVFDSDDQGRLFDLVDEMKVRTLPKSLRLGELIEYVMTELPAIAPDDPGTHQAVDLAGVIWERSRD